MATTRQKIIFFVAPSNWNAFPKKLKKPSDLRTFKLSLKNTLKAADDLKTNKEVYEAMSLICKSMYILKVYSIPYTLR